MSPAAIEASAEPTASRHEKKHKKEKKHKSDKKRAREDEEAVVDDDDDDDAAAQRKHKKSRSETGDEEGPDVDGLEKLKLVQAADDDGEGKPKKKKSKKVRVAEDEAELETSIIAPEEPQSERKKSKKKRRDEADADAEATRHVEDGTTPEKPKKKKSKRHSEAAGSTETPSKSKRHTLATDADAMDIDEPAAETSSHCYQPPDMPPKPQFPFYSQTISLYEPIYPQGWSQPVTSCQYQHLEHLKNRYVPSLRGVLLDYKNVTLGDTPGRAGAAKVDEDPAVLKSLNEYAVGFGWITADVDLFVPSRGAWMEGSVNLQTEGHIGVVCFGKFNASIEARRLPPAWKWVSNDDPGAVGMEETASVITADDHGVVRQIHSTGFWVDGSGDKIKGKIRFRIRNFDVGISGETSFLSLEGTMLDKDSEKKLVKEEAVLAAQRKGKKGGRKVQRRRAPEFAMTRFADDEDDRGAGAGAEQTETLDETTEAIEVEEEEEEED